MAKEPRFDYVRALFARIRDADDGGGDSNATGEALSIIENLMKCAKDVINNWEKGDLADAVSSLNDQLKYAEGRTILNRKRNG